MTVHLRAPSGTGQTALCGARDGLVEEWTDCPRCLLQTHITDWDQRFLDLAKHVAQWSKDPSTRCGAVVVDSDNRVMGVGYNGFARGVEDKPDRLNNRDLKYQLVLHAELNALSFAKQTRGCTLYCWPFPTCAHCASVAVQMGITRIVAPGNVPDRWRDSVKLAEAVCREAGVTWDVLE